MENLPADDSRPASPETTATELTLDDVELRVLGALIEKAYSTPEYYPLTLNALTNACNQRSNRSPVMSLETDEVRDALDALRQKRLAMMFHGADARVPKFKHTIENLFNLERPELAILAELMLRGPQTPGELRSRCERMHAFAAREEVEERLRDLEEYPGEPLVVRLPRRPGQKEQRYAHRIGREPEIEAAEAGGEFAEPAPSEPAGGLRGRVAELSEEVENQRTEIEALQTEVERLRAEFASFRKQFE